MTDRAQEEAYFYRINRDLIEQMHQRTVILLGGAGTNQNKGTIYDVLNRELQPDEHWRVDICF